MSKLKRGMTLSQAYETANSAMKMDSITKEVIVLQEQQNNLAAEMTSNLNREEQKRVHSIVSGAQNDESVLSKISQEISAL